MELIVADRGPGVPAADRDEIFQPFFRSLTPGSAVPGHGLGLAICQSIVLAHGGVWRSRIEPAVARRSASFSHFRCRQQRNEAMTRQTILVVDDEAPMRKLLSGNLKASGYEVHAAADGTQALKLIDEHPFDLLLLDVNMPGPNGLQVLEAIRRTAEIPHPDAVRPFARTRHGGSVGPWCRRLFEQAVRRRGARGARQALLRRATPGPRGPVPNYRYRGLEIDFGARRARLNGVEVPLTQREFEVLAYFARNSGKILLHRQVLQAVWGGQYGDEADYVWTFVQRSDARLSRTGASRGICSQNRALGTECPCLTPTNAQTERAQVDRLRPGMLWVRLWRPRTRQSRFAACSCATAGGPD
jgi:two-component system, OmpR family, KDP operon response regulator KdpE